MLSKPDIGKGSYQAVHIIRTRASGYPSWPGVSDSTQGRIHWRRPTAIVHFSLATLRRTIHSDNAPFIRWDEKAGLRRDAIRSQRLTRSRRNGKETGL